MNTDLLLDYLKHQNCNVSREYAVKIRNNSFEYASTLNCRGDMSIFIKVVKKYFPQLESVFLFYLHDFDNMSIKFCFTVQLPRISVYAGLPRTNDKTVAHWGIGVDMVHNVQKKIKLYVFNSSYQNCFENKKLYENIFGIDLNALHNKNVSIIQYVKDFDTYRLIDEGWKIKNLYNIIKTRCYSIFNGHFPEIKNKKPSSMLKGESVDGSSISYYEQFDDSTENNI